MSPPIGTYDHPRGKSHFWNVLIATTCPAAAGLCLLLIFAPRQDIAPACHVENGSLQMEIRARDANVRRFVFWSRTKNEALWAVEFEHWPTGTPEKITYGVVPAPPGRAKANQLFPASKAAPRDLAAGEDFVVTFLYLHGMGFPPDEAMSIKFFGFEFGSEGPVRNQGELKEIQPPQQVYDVLDPTRL